MNNETNIVQSKPKTSGKKRAKKAVAFLLVFAILITSAYAFLTAHQTKTNVFTVGNIRLELHEDGWENNPNVNVLNVDGKNVDNSDYITRSKLENIIPGEPITKDPMIKNVGKNPAYVFISVAMPQVLGNDMFTINDLSSDWVVFNTVEDGDYVVTYYYYNGQLAPNTDTSNLFTTITLNDSAYEHLDENADYSIIVNGYGAQTTAVDEWKEAWNKIVETDNSLPEVEIIRVDYYREDLTLFASEDTVVGDPIEMKFDNTLAKDNYSFNWVDENGNIAYEGMPMPQHRVKLTASYEKLTDAPVSHGFIEYQIIEDNGSLALATRSLIYDNIPSDITSISIPSQLSFIITDEMVNQFNFRSPDAIDISTSACGYYVDTLDNDILTIYPDLDLSRINTNTVYTLPVVEVSGIQISNQYSQVSNVNQLIIPSTVKSINSNNVSLITDLSPLPYCLESLGNYALVGLKTDLLEFPASLEHINNALDPFQNGEIGTVVIPKSMKSIDNQILRFCTANKLDIDGDWDQIPLPSQFQEYIIRGNINTVDLSYGGGYLKIEITETAHINNLYASSYDVNGDYDISLRYFHNDFTINGLVDNMRLTMNASYTKSPDYIKGTGTIDSFTLNLGALSDARNENKYQNELYLSDIVNSFTYGDLDFSNYFILNFAGSEAKYSSICQNQIQDKLAAPPDNNGSFTYTLNYNVSF